jgi:hypothetical protein
MAKMVNPMDALRGGIKSGLPNPHRVACKFGFGEVLR